VAYDEKTAERVRKALAGRRGVVEKKLMGGLCFMVGGGMCCSVSGKGGLLVRIDPDDQEKLFAQPHVRPMEMGGRVMTGFVRVDPAGYRTEAALRNWIARGVEAVAARAAKQSRGKRRSPPTRGKK
jgi:TfoX/Sxy family transcriptional regulator of competence genes